MLPAASLSYEANKQNAVGVKVAQVNWLVPGIIPMGRLTVIDGDPGQGKSFLTLELASALTRGYQLSPKGRVRGVLPAANVVIMNAEDDMAATMLPRLIGLNADLARVTFCNEGRKPGGKTVPLYFPDDTACIEHVIKECEAKLLIIDPIMAFLSPDVRTNSDQSVRHALSGLKIMADNLGCAIVMVRHLNKSGGNKVIYRGGGSIGIVGLTRAAAYVGPHPEDRSMKIFAPVKNNLAPLAGPWQFKMVSKEDKRTIRWLGEADIPLSRILDTPVEMTAGERCARFLLDNLAKGQTVEVKQLMDKAKADGLSYATLMRVKKEVGVEVMRIGKVTYWVIRKIKA